MTNNKFHKLFGSIPRKPEGKLKQRHMDIAHSIQDVVEIAVMKMAKHLQKKIGCKNLCMAGGVALNCVVNGRILKEGLFENIWIQPASSDAGGALGAALIGWHEYLGNSRKVNPGQDSQKASLLGPVFKDEEIEKYLKENNILYEYVSYQNIPEVVADLIAGQKVIGWFQGKMEFGPRALGARSILADPRSTQMQSIINLKIKFRESFRPFAPSVLADKAQEYFDLNVQSPYMLIVASVSEKKRHKSVDEEKLKGLDKLKAARSDIPAVTHVDYSARVQTVTRLDNQLYYDMINKFNEKYGCPLVINTSFNIRGEPIVCAPDDAYKCFMHTNMDYLIIGGFLLDKNKQDKSKLELEEIDKAQLD